MKVLYIDMDNTIAENKTCQNVEFTSGLYLSKRPIQVVIDAINTLYEDVPKVIVTKVQGGEEGIKEKRMWLEKYAPFPIEDIIFVQGDYYMKGVLIDQYNSRRNIPNEETLLVDDSKQVLRYCSAYNIQTKYPQQLICDYEQVLQMKLGKSKYKKKSNDK